MKNARDVVYVRRGHLSTGLREVVAYDAAEGAEDGIVLDDDGTEPDGEPVWTVCETSPGLARVDLGASILPERPALWFVWVDEPGASPAATNLVAFGGGRFPAGTIVSRYAFATAGVSNDDQAGAVRWYPRDGMVHQVFVAPPWRRRFVASTLLYTADAFHQAQQWPGKLHGDGRRTALGQLLAAGLRHPGRILDLAEEMPPMDPETARE